MENVQQQPRHLENGRAPANQTLRSKLAAGQPANGSVQAVLGQEHFNTPNPRLISALPAGMIMLKGAP